MTQICKWTDSQKMKLNEDKSKAMIFNFSKKYQFSTRILMNNSNLEIVEETKILGLIITPHLGWRRNTENLVTKANKRLFMLRNLVQFPIPIKELVILYGQFIRTILEFNSNVWFSSITEEESDDLERVQKSVCKILLKNRYTCYEEALNILKLEDLKARRLKQALKFGKGCLEIDQMKPLFLTKSDCTYNLRNQEYLNVQHASRQRLYKSTIPSLQRLMNQDKNAAMG